MKYTSRGGRRSYKSFSLYKEDKKSIEDYIFHIESHKQIADFKIINKFIINCIKKTCTYRNNIFESLRSLIITDTEK